MKRYSDEEIMAAIRAVWLRSAVDCVLDRYTGETYKIHSRDGYDHFVRALTWRVEGIPPSVVRNRVRKLAEKFSFKVWQSHEGAALEIKPPKDEAVRLVELGQRWWAHIGYSTSTSLPKLSGHRYPKSEQEILQGAAHEG